MHADPKEFADFLLRAGFFDRDRFRPSSLTVKVRSHDTHIACRSLRGCHLRTCCSCSARIRTIKTASKMDGHASLPLPWFLPPVHSGRILSRNFI